MLKKDITYTDFDDNKCTDTFYFNLTKTEVVELEVSEKGGYGAFLQKIVDEEDNKMILVYIKDLIRRALDQDGRRPRMEARSGPARDRVLHDYI